MVYLIVKGGLLSAKDFLVKKNDEMFFFANILSGIGHWRAPMVHWRPTEGHYGPLQAKESQTK